MKILTESHRFRWGHFPLFRDIIDNVSPDNPKHRHDDFEEVPLHVRKHLRHAENFLQKEASGYYNHKPEQQDDDSEKHMNPALEAYEKHYGDLHESLLEAAPPGWGEWIEHRKAEGMKTSTAFALAWKNYNEGKTYRKSKGRKSKSGEEKHGHFEKVRRARMSKKELERRRKERQKSKGKSKPKRHKISESIFSLAFLKRILENTIPVNNVGGGNIAGLGENSGEPGFKKKKKFKVMRRNGC